MSDAAPARPDYARLLAGGFDLRGRAAFVPGGYGGIGEAIAWGLALAGARVAVAGRSSGKAEALAARLADAGHDAIGVVMDAHATESIRAAVDAVAARFGALDLLVNCVGIQREQRHADVTEATFDEIVQVNLKAAMFMSQAVARHQIAGAAAGRTGARQLHVLSVRAQLGMRDRGYSAYCATKGALVMLIKQHAVELSAHGITVNGVAPTVVRTPLAGRWLTDPDIHRQLIERIPLGRIAEVDDVVGPTLFFLSDASAFVTGQILYVDGGVTASQ